MLQLKRSLLVFTGLSLICGLIYPLAITAISQRVFPGEANGGIIKNGEQIVGSRLVGQLFTSPKYFQGRPSASDPQYDAGNSGGSNLAPSNARLIAQAATRVERIRIINRLSSDAPIPADLVLASGSGLDPHISPMAAALQIERIAAERNIPPAAVKKIIQQNTEQPLLGIWGKERVNVLQLNLALDGIKTGR
jgi:potassium-transporting ATPase KdpC subunit